MVQVLPYVPSFGEKLAPILAQAGGDISEGLRTRRAKTEWERLITPRQSGSPIQQDQTQTQMAQVSPLQEILNQPEGPTLQQTLALSKKAKDAGYSDKVVENFLLNQQKSSQKEGQQIRKEERAERRTGIEKRTEAMMGSRESINAQRRKLQSARTAVRSGNVGAFSRNSLADLFGESGKRFKDASAAQLEAATKHLLITSLGDVTAKGTNLWLEKVALSAAPGLGKTDEANEALITIALGELDINEKKLDVEQDLLTKYDQQGIKPPPNFDKIVDDLIKPYAKKIEEQTAYDTRVNYEKESGKKLLDKNVHVPKGTPLTLAKRDALLRQYNGDKEKARQKALELGYTIPDPNTVLIQENQ